MATDDTKIVISLETVLKNLNQTLRGLDAVKKRLDSIGNIKAQSRDADRALLAAQKLGVQQQKLSVQTQELNNRQERARIVSERLAQSQQRLTITQQRLDQAQQRVTRSAGQQADAHVQAFRAIQRGFADANAHVRTFRAMQASLAKAPQLDAHVRAFRAIQKGAEDANHHVRVFRAQQAALAKAPQIDAHVRAFRQMEAASGGLNRSLSALGNSLRSVGQGLASFGATLAFTVSAPLAALGASVTNAAVRLDSLQRGLRTIAGSSQEAAEQLERLTRIAKLPGIGFEEAIQGSIRLQAVGFSAAEAERALRQFSNAIALTGGGREQLESVTVQLGQMAAQSKVLAADLKPIINAAPAVAVALRQAFGTVRSEELQELGIQSKEFISILVGELERLPRAAAGARNSFENFRDELFRAAATVGTVLLPALTRLVEVAGPIVTTLANAFAALPAPLQVIVVGFTALLAIAGPVTFIIGQLTLGIGRLIVGFAELNATGILPTIASLRALTAGTLSAAAAQRTLAATTALVSGGVGLVLTALAAVVTGFALYKAFQKDSITLSREQIDALSDQIVGLREQAKFVTGLSVGVERTADEQQRLLDIYSDLNRAAKIRITSITDEEQRLTALREELQRLIVLREQERIQQAAGIAGELASNLQRIQANEAERDSVAARIQSNAALIETLEREQVISAASTRALAERGITAATVEDAIGRLKSESESLSASQDALITASKELNDTAKDQVATVRALEQQTGLTARELLVAAQSMGRFRGDVAAIIPVLERYIQKTEQAAGATDKFNRSLSENERRLNEAGERAENAAKGRRTLIASAAAVARETSVDFAGALKSLRQMVEAVPELSAALRRESELTGKSLDELLRGALDDAFKGRAKSTDTTGLRNAQEQLARALADSAQASADEIASIEVAKNERLLQANDNLFRLQLISYRQYLSERARLTNANLQLEINAQRALADAAADERDRLVKRSQQAGVPPAESTRARAQAAQAEAQRIAAETRIVALQAQQRQNTDEVAQSLAEAQKQQFEDVRKLEGEYAELRGRIEDALNAATDERFRESLQALSIAQDDLNKRLQLAREIGDASAQAELEQAQALNQRQIEAVEGIVAQERATNRLTTAQRFIEEAKERQADLERQLAFEVDFRGLKEEEAIRRRLAGEDQLRQRLEIARGIIQDQIDILSAAGVRPPQALLDFLRETNDAIRGLGELPFTEQFRLAEKEFNRINDLRIQKIQDVERAVRNRDIAEIEGLILIRRINGQYAGDLERQLELLKAIADKSGQDELRTRTADIGETVKDAKDEVADFDRQLRAVSIDSLQDSLGQLFKDLRDNSQTALEDILNFLNRISTAISDMIAENLAKEFIESLFPDPATTGGGVIGFFKRTLGVGGGAGVEAAAHGAEATEHAVAATTLTTGATAAATALTAGGATAGATLLTSIAAAATAFSAAVIAAGTAFAAAVGLSSTAQQAGNFTRFIGGGESGLYPAVPGGLYKFVEGGYPEAVITTDPRYAARQVSILRELIAKTRGFYGRVPEFAGGAIVSRETAEANLLSSINRAPQFSPSLPASAMETATAVGMMNLRITNQVNSRALVEPYLSSEAGVRHIKNIISANSNDIARRIPTRGR